MSVSVCGMALVWLPFAIAAPQYPVGRDYHFKFARTAEALSAKAEFFRLSVKV